MKLSIIIVNYNSGDLLKRCIDSVIRWTKELVYEIIIVDNNSSDDSMKSINIIPASLTVIVNPSNLGFSKASNVGIGRASGDVIVLLNPDTMLIEDALGPMYERVVKDRSIGALGCKLVFPDGAVQTSAYAYTSLGKTILQFFMVPLRPFAELLSKVRLFRSISVLRPYLLRYSSDKCLIEVDFVTGACMMFRKDLVSTIGLMDESFFMYYEDEDFCRRIKMAGFRVAQDLGVSIVHGFGWGKRGANITLIRERYNSLSYYCNKYYKGRVIYSASFSVINTTLFRISEGTAKLRSIIHRRS